MDRVTVSRAVDILARFLPRSGESREDGLSVGDSGLSGPAIVECVEVVIRGRVSPVSLYDGSIDSLTRGICVLFDEHLKG